MAPPDSNSIYSATYSNVPVYEFNCEGNHVMRRRHDDFINATHILKVADLDKPARTRVLEREVQKGPHEKIQGGYGKYQGTWVPLPEGRVLATKNRVYEKLKPIFDYVPGDQSPPQAPKHTTAASNRPKIPKPPPVARRVPNRVSEDHFESSSVQYNDEEMADNVTIDSGSYEDDDMLQSSQYSTGSRKRKRDMDRYAPLSHYDEQHLAYADELLDYFMLSSSEAPVGDLRPPIPPDHFDVNRAIDEQGHTALHWASAMGDTVVVQDLLDRGANPGVRSLRGETPLMRAVLFTNNYEKQTMPKLIRRLVNTVHLVDNCHSTVFHHIAATTGSRSKFACARYYCDTIANKLSENLSAPEIAQILDGQDMNRDTALLIAARHHARKCVRSLTGHGASSHIVNSIGETADQLLAQLNASRGRDRFPFPSSSPFQPPSRERVPIDPSLGAMVVDGPPPPPNASLNNSLARSFTPALVEKSNRLAQAYEKELIEKEADLLEAKRLRAKMDQDLAAVRQQALDLLSTHPGEDEDCDAATTTRAEKEQLASLERQIASWIEQAQRDELARLYREASSTSSNTSPSTLKSSSSSSPSSSPPTADDSDSSNKDSTLRDKLTLAISLSQAQRTRRTLVSEIVHNQSLAGLGGARQTQYQRLIGRCLDLPEDEVETMLPEICGELEEAGGKGA